MGSRGGANIQNRLVDTMWEGEGEMNGESSKEAYTRTYGNG